MIRYKSEVLAMHKIFYTRVKKKEKHTHVMNENVWYNTLC